MSTLTFRPSKTQDKLLTGLSKLAEKNNVSLNKYIEQVLVEHLEKKANYGNKNQNKANTDKG